ncbi:BZ3500_MvSof-1268-A1-R1_Chr9g10517 [Microbotryum saponariae]|uniref:BZ3500_MvSof-1268-A1-R1_Chr9g10517 protein n=1 Tax=Microbotryum saponariae TaxID=289078 RepID=A0A2X0N652_9BASI|nr:BZ3501_MvSof-1269-A2-R1_Chr9g10266 [Microbotryum saponariae]SDA00227.1 BZ3500_MvSof-1268-A1-R1_Chr9g10517 [Microbotryum saponariae]
MSNLTGVVACIDFAQLGHSPALLAAALKEAMGKTGFIFIKNHGLEQKVKKMFDISETFFREETMEEKQRTSYQNNRGYTRVSQETLDPTKPDLDMKEGFNLAYVSLTDPPHPVQPIPSLLQPHLTSLAEFEQSCFEFCQTLLRAFAVLLDLNNDFFTRELQHNEESGSILRFLHYPKVEKGQSVHRTELGLIGLFMIKGSADYGSLTLLFQRSSGGEGLQILPSTEPLDSPNWQNVGLVEDALLVNIGDALELWSGAILKSTLHRVVLPPRDEEVDAVQERFSIAWFNQPKPSASLKTVVPVSQISENDLSRMERKGVVAGSDITAAQHLQARLASTYKLK